MPHTLTCSIISLIISSCNLTCLFLTHIFVVVVTWLLTAVFSCQLICFLGEENGNPLQYSCLESPVDRGAWWAAVHRVTQSQTRLKWLSMHACIREGSGNPLQHSCLENPMDRGAWWAAVHRVTQSQTWLKRLSMHAWVGEGNGIPLQ